jgi:hypothetical protein
MRPRNDEINTIIHKRGLEELDMSLHHSLFY